MKCKLCLKEKDLRNSHIIPEFLYKTLYDEKHRLFEISTNENKSSKLLQRGVREKLLCGECEEIFSKNERYASLVLNGRNELLVIPEPPVVHFKNIDYTKFKLFALSILWRAGVASKEVFGRVQLGRHENSLRELLLDGLPGDEAQYPFVLMPVIHEGEVVESLIVPPEKTRVGEHNAYLFIFGGIAWTYIVTSHAPPKVILDASLDYSGQLTMLPKQLSDIKYIVNYAQKLVSQEKI